MISRAWLVLCIVWFYVVVCRVLSLFIWSVGNVWFYCFYGMCCKFVFEKFFFEGGIIIFCLSYFILVIVCLVFELSVA